MEPMEKPRDWPRLRRQIRAAWPKVSDDDLDQAGGDLRVVAGLIEERLNIETRSVTLGHLQRGGSPSAYDRVLATRFGIKAGELVLSGQFGHMASLRGTDIVAVPLSEAVSANRRLDLRFYEEAKEFFPG